MAAPPENAGETQAHGVILYVYPRNDTIDKKYSGCQHQWFYDDDHYRKLSTIHYIDGVATVYENIGMYGDIAYACHYEKGKLNDEDDRRCPQHEELKKKTYQAGCFSLSKLNSSDSYDVSSKDCVIK